jgi:hypothetical protein
VSGDVGDGGAAHTADQSGAVRDPDDVRLADAVLDPAVDPDSAGTVGQVGVRDLTDEACRRGARRGMARPCRGGGAEASRDEGCGEQDAEAVRNGSPFGWSRSQEAVERRAGPMKA